MCVWLTEVVKGTHGYGVKRGSQDDGAPARKKQATSKKAAEDHSGSMYT